MNQTFQIKQVIIDSWQLVKKNIKFLLLAIVVSWIAQFAISSMQGISDNVVISIILSLVTWVLGSVITMGLLSIALKLVGSGSVSYQDSYANIDKIGKYLLGSIYYSVIVFVGMLLLIVPGIILALRYQFYSYLILDKGMAPKEALSKSKEMTKGNLGKLFLFGLVLAGINLVGALLLGLGLLVSIPVSLIAMTLVYKSLSGESIRSASTSSAPASSDDQDWKNYRQTRKSA